MQGSLERLSPALVSSDLSVSNECRGDVDFVAALGYASRNYPMASPLIRMYLTHDKASVSEARRIAYQMAKKAAARRREVLRTVELIHVGKMALAYAANKVCPRCNGTRFELVPWTNVLGTVACSECGGDGRRKLPKRHSKLIAEVVAKIERIESNIESIVGQRV